MLEAVTKVTGPDPEDNDTATTTGDSGSDILHPT